jgi:hypothetical protein
MNSVNQLLALLPAGGWQRLMCDALWQSALIATLGWLVARFMMRQSAARAWVLLLTISACMIVPLASSVSRSMGWTVLASVERVAAEEGEKGRRAEGEILSQSFSHVTETPMISLVKTSSDESQIASSKIESKPSLTGNVTRPAVSPLLPSSPSPFLGLNSYQLLALIWLTASTLLVSRLLLSSLAVRRILRRAKPCDDAQILTAAVDAARRVGLKIAPAVLTSADIDSPMVLALGQPRLLVPQSTPRSA